MAPKILQHSATNGNIVSQGVTKCSKPNFCDTLRHFATLCDLMETRLVDGESKALFSAALKVRNLFLRLSGLFGTGLCNLFFPNSLLTESCKCL